jgi:hypothetical protein
MACSIFLISNAQTEKKVGDFTKVSSFDKIDVQLIPSNENKVSFTWKRCGSSRINKQKWRIKN